MTIYTCIINNLKKKTINDIPKEQLQNIDNEKILRGGIVTENINILTSKHTGLGNNLFDICNLLGYCWDNNLSYSFPDLNLLYSKIKEYPKTAIYHKLPITKADKIVKGKKYYYKNFHKYRDKIIDLFNIDEDSLKYINNKYSKYFNKITISIHVRRGDFVFISERWNKEYIVKKTYHYNALNYLKTKLNNNDFNILVFSNDIEWCKVNLIFEDFNVHYVSGNLDYIDLWLMSMCNHNIIESSTMSWWAAYLNKNKNKIVICPKKSIFKERRKLDDNNKNYYPPNWIILNE
tara:strand:+ start:532 stop:1404 length:873 start_codon:yes stop_codon:yes gene_type:complete